MYQFNNLTSNVPNVQTFNSNGPVTYISQGTRSYTYLGVNVSGVPAANGQLYQRNTTTIAYFKTDSTGATAPTPVINNQFTYGDGGSNGWLDATITAVTDSGTYWLITVSRAFTGTLSIGFVGTLDVKSPTFYPWQTWTKPNDAMLIHILCIGGGGGGGGGDRGFTISGTSRWGGGGGGSAAVTSMYVPAFLIPDTLYILIGAGGNGAPAMTPTNNFGANGYNGNTSYVALYPNYTGIGQVGNLLLSASGGGGGFGGTYTTGTGGSAGGATAVGAAAPFYLGLGQFTSVAGQGGGTSSGTASPTALIIGASGNGITCGGAAGGTVLASNSGVSGGAINSPSELIPYLTSVAGPVNAFGVNATGSNGYSVKKPLMFIGGTGGAGNSTDSLRDCSGGNGNIGSGGGGGGAKSANGPAGGGGKGGDGLVIITSY